MKNKLFACMLIMLVIVLLPGVIGADDSYVISEEYAGNLYLTNPEILAKSNVYGDLFAFSQNIEIEALIRDDVNAVSSNFIMTGTIGSDLRLVSSNVEIDGVIFGETFIAGSSVVIGDNAAIGGRTNINANSVIINGTLKNDAKISAESVVLNGVIEGDAEIHASRFVLGPDARILGDLSSPLDVDEATSYVEGAVTKTERKDAADSFTSLTFRKIGLFLSIFLVGALLVFVSGKFTEKLTKNAGSKFLLSLIAGLILLVAMPFIILFIAITVVGLPLAILLGLLYFAAITAALGISALLFGRGAIKLFKGKKDMWTELLIGSLSLALLSIVPPLFWGVIIILGMVSVGAIGLTLFKARKAK